MTGLDISRELTKRYPREDLPPLVALTANVLKDKQEYLNAGMDDVLSKPLSVPALTAMIKKFWDTQEPHHGGSGACYVALRKTAQAKQENWERHAKRSR